jgi:hypothetical protein
MPVIVPVLMYRVTESGRNQTCNSRENGDPVVAVNMVMDILLFSSSRNY